MAEHTFLLPDAQTKSQSSGIRVKILRGSAILGILLILFHEQGLMFIGDFLVVQASLHRADVIHVIAGEDYRTDYAIQLYERGLASTLFFTGGWCKLHMYYHGEHARERALAYGLHVDAIAIDDSDVTSTYMEAERLKEWIAQSPDPVRSIIVVSDPFHMRRARWTYQKVFGDSIAVQLAPVPFAMTPYQRNWWRNQQSRQNVQDEYVKFVYYLFRYQYSWGILKDWLVSFDTE
jgi:uncharacterized SAM-binding protein YcdF (DUF218 family)